MNDATIDQIDRIIDEEVDTWLNLLARYVDQPSIASQGLGMEETAHMTAGMLEEAGFEVRIMPTALYPIVYGEAAGASDHTLLMYNHYDVQPAEPLELWDSPPFQTTRRDGKMYGRGISDDKGHVVSRLAALSAVRRVLREYPCRLKFMIEGGEEIGSPHVPEFVEEHRDLLAADACVWEFGGVGYDGRPNLVLGLRGLLYVEYHVRTMRHDAHSGFAHLLPNAAWRLLRALTTIKDENERVLIDGFYDDVRGPSETDLRMLEEMTESEEDVKRSYEIENFNLGLTGFEAKKAVFSPTANIAGLSSGYEGAGTKTVTPSTAMAKMDFRLVPDQNPADILRKLRRHLDLHGFEDVEVRHLGSEWPGQTASDHAFVRMTAETALEVYGKPANISPLLGGSGPIHPFIEYLKVPVVSLGIGYPESNAHAPNENITIEGFEMGTKHMARLLMRFADRRA